MDYFFYNAARNCFYSKNLSLRWGDPVHEATVLLLKNRNEEVCYNVATSISHYLDNHPGIISDYCVCVCLPCHDSRKSGCSLVSYYLSSLNTSIFDSSFYLYHTLGYKALSQGGVRDWSVIYDRLRCYPSALPSPLPNNCTWLVLDDLSHSGSSFKAADEFILHRFPDAHILNFCYAIV